MPTTLFTTTPAREVLYEVAQYIAGRLTGGDQAVKIGTLPIGAVITIVNSKVVTAVTGGTPAIAVGTAPGGAQVVAAIAAAAGSQAQVPVAALVMPFTVPTDIYVTSSGGTTAGDVIGEIEFIKPVA